MKIFFAVLVFLFSIQLNANGFNFASNYIPIGINAGYGGNGLVLGGELSFVHFGNSFAYGLFIDALRNKNGNRIFAGPEIFFPLKSGTFIGFEAGAVTNFNTNKNGFMAGLFFFTKTPIIPYVRYFNISGKNTAEAGVLVKIPIPIED